jgi:hypothetical protein
MERLENIWTSSERHLNIFKEIKGKKNVLLNADDPSVGERFHNFPRIIAGNYVFPVIFENIGRLVFSEDSILFYSNPVTDSYKGINKESNLFISYNTIVDLELVKYRRAFIPYFDNTWIKITFLDNAEKKEILISNSGKGLVMKKIRKKNIELMELIKNRMTT